VGNRPLVVTDPTGMVWAYNKDRNKYQWFAGDELTDELKNEGWSGVSVGREYMSENNHRILLGANGRWVDLGYAGPTTDFQHGFGTDITTAFIETTVKVGVQAGLSGGASLIQSAAGLARELSGEDIPSSVGRNPTSTKHDAFRKNQARTGFDERRNVGDANRVIREGKRYLDTETGNTVYVGKKGHMAVVSPDGERTVSRNTLERRDVQKRVNSGRWVRQ
jgi:hypothetical protein